MNRCKAEAPSKYPNGFIRNFKGIKYFFHIGFRQVEGIVSALSGRVEELKAPDYTTVWERASKIAYSIAYAVEDHGWSSTLLGLKVYDGGE